MNRWGLGLAFALVLSQGVFAGDLPPSAQAAKTRASAHCAALGEGFFPLAGSHACVRISGRISAGAGFGTGLARGGPASLDFDPSPANGLGGQAAAAGDLRFDTPNGPARIYLDVGNSASSRW